MIVPGATIGILGGGQLGRMTGLAAREMGYDVAVFEPGPRSPAGQIASLEVNADYTDFEALDRWIEAVQVVTYEFENVPPAAARRAAARRATHPAPGILEIAQNRAREKQFLREGGFACAPFAVVGSAEELRAAAERIGLPAILKTADFGYDGKGQRRLDAVPRDWMQTWREFGADRAVLEAHVDFERELSVIVAANEAGEVVAHPTAENIHTRHILDFTLVPARVPAAVDEAASELARAIARQLGLVGLLAVEMFLTRDGRLLVNELAPRPHNSGHWSIDGALTSQFEQHVRAICGLPLGDPRMLRPAVMVNLLGDLWARGTPDWNRVLRQPGAKLHLYAKREPRPGRKMGHFTIVGDDLEGALARARSIKRELAGDAREASG